MTAHTPSAELATDVLVIGWGLSGLVAAAEAIAAGRRVVVLDQEPRANLGGQAWWSFGGLFFIDSPEQRRLGIRDSLDLARQDWFATAGFDRDDDAWPRRWAEATSTSRRARSARGCASAASDSSPSWGGRSAAGTRLSARATRCRASTSRGARVRESSCLSNARSKRPRARAASSCSRATA